MVKNTCIKSGVKNAALVVLGWLCFIAGVFIPDRLQNFRCWQLPGFCRKCPHPVMSNPAFHPTGYSGLRPLPPSGEFER